MPPCARTARIGTIDYNVLMNSSPATVDDFNRMPLKVAAGVPVTIGDVARVEDGFTVQSNIVHVDGRRATYLTILKHSDASSLSVVKGVRDLLEEIRAGAPEGMDITLDFDQSKFVRAAITNVAAEAVLASLLVSLMILLFLGSWRNTIVVITSIPCAMFAGIIALYLTGNTINLMSLIGVILLCGIVAKNAILLIDFAKWAREKNGMPVDAPFWHEKPLALEAYEEALDGVTYAGMGGYPAIQEAFYLAAEACLDVMEPGWRERV
jgi:multidrug efflux pump subunit AcrB